MTLAAKREFVEALKQFDNSEALDSNNGLNKYQKANTLVKLEQYDAAI
jgi:anaphase-promoting complex subunit 3